MNGLKHCSAKNLLFVFFFPCLLLLGVCAHSMVVLVLVLVVVVV